MRRRRNVDPKTSVEIMELLAEVARSREIPVLVNMHDVEFAKRFADRIIGMREGRVVFDGTPTSLKQVEAVRASGAPFASVLAFGVLPQVFSRFIGFATYQLDSNLRNSTMVGIVGAGGIGGTLFAAFQRFDYDFVCAILIAIITLIMTH
jgi:hypothetical protein